MSEYKGPERVDASQLAPGASTSFSRMHSAADISSAVASAPDFHSRVFAGLKAQGSIRDDSVASSPARQQATSRRAYIKGARVQHKETGKKLVIIKANAGYTKQSHTPAHRVADNKGNVWDIAETKLRLL